MSTIDKPTMQVNVCAKCFPLVEKYQNPKEILRQLRLKGCSKCKLIAYAYAMRIKR